MFRPLGGPDSCWFIGWYAKRHDNFQLVCLKDLFRCWRIEAWKTCSTFCLFDLIITGWLFIVICAKTVDIFANDIAIFHIWVKPNLKIDRRLHTHTVIRHTKLEGKHNINPKPFLPYSRLLFIMNHSTLAWSPSIVRKFMTRLCYCCYIFFRNRVNEKS